MDWIQEYFVNPIAHPNDYAPYNAVNTLVFAAIALCAAYVIYKGLQRSHIKINERFFTRLFRSSSSAARSAFGRTLTGYRAASPSSAQLFTRS